LDSQFFKNKEGRFS
jgi:hypothetical protein